MYYIHINVNNNFKIVESLCVENTELDDTIPHETTCYPFHYTVDYTRSL